MIDPPGNRFHAVLLAAQAERRRRQALIAERALRAAPLLDRAAMAAADELIEAEEQARFVALRNRHKKTREIAKLPARADCAD